MGTQSNTVPLEFRKDEDDPNNVYIGRAYPGAIDGSPVWQITLISTTGGQQSTLHCDGNNLFQYQWDLRLTYTYL